MHVPSVDEPGLSFDPMVIHQGANSGFQALNLAVLMGAARVLLLGYDMGSSDAKTHWHGNHPAGLNNPGAQNFANWIAAFNSAAGQAIAAGIDIVNCTPGGALDCFARQELSEALNA